MGTPTAGTGRANHLTLDNGESGLSFRNSLNAMFYDLYGPNMALQTTIWVDPNRIDDYTLSGVAAVGDGSFQFPFKSLGAVFSTLSTSTLAGLTINLASSTYTEATQVTVPATLTGPVVINGNGSTVSFNTGLTIPTALAYPVVFYNLNLTGPGTFLIQNSVAAGVQNGTQFRNLIDGGSVGMPVSIGTIGGATTGTLEARSTIFSNSITVYNSSFFYPVGTTYTGAFTMTVSGTLHMQACRVLYNPNAFAIVSTSPGSVVIYDTFLNNTNAGTSAGCINVTNGATGALPNVLSNIVALATNTTIATVVSGSSVTYFSKIYSNSTVPFWNAGTSTGMLALPDLVPTAINTTGLYSGLNPISLNASGASNLYLPTTAGGYVPVTGNSNQVLSFTAPAGTTVLTLTQSGTQAVLTTNMTAPLNFSSASGGGTVTSTSIVAMGLGLAGATFTPNTSSRILVTVTGMISNSATTAVTVGLYTGTGTAPTYNTALSGGTLRGLAQNTGTLVVGQRIPFSFSFVVTGTVLNSAMWIDLGVAQVTSGTATLFNMMVSAVEV